MAEETKVRRSEPCPRRGVREWDADGGGSGLLIPGRARRRRRSLTVQPLAAARKGEKTWCKFLGFRATPYFRFVCVT